MSGYAEDYFYLNRWILCCAGLWAPKNKNKIIQFVYKIYAIVVFLFVNVYFTATEFASLLYTYGNEDDLIKNLSIALTHLMGTVKVVFFYLRGDKLIELMQVLESEELRYDDIKEKQFLPGLISRSYKATIIKCTLLCFLLPHFTLFSSYIPPTTAALLYVSGGNTTRQLPENLPYYSWVPFKFDTGYSYLIALGYQAGPMFSFGYSISGMDSLFVSIMHCIAGNLTIIQGAFLTIRERSLKGIKGPALAADRLNNSECLNTAMNLEMRKVCKNLQTIFKVCEDLESIHKYVTLAQVSATLLILCSCLYLVSTSPVNSKQFYAEIIYLVAMGSQPFMYCWFGNEVTLKTEEMSTYIWQSDWLAADVKFKTCMIITMTRLMKPVYLTVGNFAPLTLATFVAIIKASYSFFTFITNTSE